MPPVIHRFRRTRRIKPYQLRLGRHKAGAYGIDANAILAHAGGEGTRHTHHAAVELHRLLDQRLNAFGQPIRPGERMWPPRRPRGSLVRVSARSVH